MMYLFLSPLHRSLHSFTSLHVTCFLESGLSSYEHEPKAGGESLLGLLEFARKHVPKTEWTHTPVYLYAYETIFLHALFKCLCLFDLSLESPDFLTLHLCSRIFFVVFNIRHSRSRTQHCWSAQHPCRRRRGDSGGMSRCVVAFALPLRVPLGAHHSWT
jgi:hypothetical protein